MWESVLDTIHKHKVNISFMSCCPPPYTCQRLKQTSAKERLQIYTLFYYNAHFRGIFLLEGFK